MTRWEKYIADGIELYTAAVCACGTRLWSPYTTSKEDREYNTYWEYDPEMIHFIVGETECRFGGSKFRAKCQESLNEKTR